ncbi:hypothetical protein I350_01982 [Cryptococcus amylolentus CBS 6273]|uniref:Uncharacterized protein n=1 Tax=Cryptococcus amylolentus CBS 6273 TaxID=1296118 RepID=A0A1E3K9V5_9TREE|nr:hypothetical protein I350_01982 [Cryptococcus amylolentus CBS 6273]
MTDKRFSTAETQSKCSCPPGNCQCESCPKSSKTEASGACNCGEEKKEKTQTCGCNGSGAACTCAPGQCACANCEKPAQTCSCGGSGAACTCPPGQCACANCGEKEVKAQTCGCGGEGAACTCAPGQCGCASCPAQAKEAPVSKPTTCG